MSLSAATVSALPGDDTANKSQVEGEDSLGVLVKKVSKCSLEEGEAVVGPELLVKHPLQNAWTLWFFKNDKARTWEENQRPIVTVTSVEDFWCLYNHIEMASKLPLGSDFSLFKEGIFPDWEDPRNQVQYSRSSMLP